MIRSTPTAHRVDLQACGPCSFVLAGEADRSQMDAARTERAVEPGMPIALVPGMMNTEDSVLLAAMRRAPRGEQPVRPVRLQRLSDEARDTLDDMMESLERKLGPLGIDRDSIRRDVFGLLRIESSAA